MFLFHNLWELSWKLIITLIGWASLMIGLALFIIPKAIVAWLNFINVKLVQVIPYYYLLLLSFWTWLMGSCPFNCQVQSSSWWFGHPWVL